MVELATKKDAIPLCKTAANRAALSPSLDDRIYYIPTRTIQRWSGAGWVNDTPGVTGDGSGFIKVYNVFDHGAVGGGVTEDTTAFQAAIDAAFALGGGFVYAPCDTYLIDKLTMKSGVYLFSDGATLKRKPELTVDQGTLFFQSVMDCGLLGSFQLDGNYDNQTLGVGSAPLGVLVSTGCKRLIFDTIYAYDWKQDAFYIGQSGTPPEDIQIRYLVVDASGRNGMSITNGKNIHVGYVRVTDTRSPANPGAGIDIETNLGTDTLESIRFDHIEVSGCSGPGLSILGKVQSGALPHGDVSIGELHSHSNTKHGLELRRIKGISIQRAHIHHNTLSGIVAPEDVQNVQVRGDVHSNGLDGIEIIGSSAETLGTRDFMFEGRCFNNSQTTPNTEDGVRVDKSASSYTPKYIFLRGSFYDDQGSATQRYGFTIGTAEDVLVLALDLSGNVSGAYVNGSGDEMFLLRDRELFAAGGFRQPIDGWYQDDVAASQSAVVLTRLAGTGDDAWIALRSGSVTGVSVQSNAARSAGTLTVEVYKNGAGTGLTAVLDGTNTTFKATTQAKDTDTFVAGDKLDIRITTDGSWAPTTADIRASLEVET